MNADAGRLKRDLDAVETALGLNIWTRRDVQRGLLGVLGGCAAGLFLWLWAAFGGAPLAGLAIFLAMLAAGVVLKDYGFRRNPVPAAGSGREVAFYQRFYVVGSLFIGGFFLWGEHLGISPRIVFACSIVMAGLWYLIYAISARSRWISMGGAIPLTICGFMLPKADGLPQMLCWLGAATFAGCAAEAVFLLVVLRSPPAPAEPNANPPPPPSAPPAPVHAAH